jgi:hypothetical protein
MANNISKCWLVINHPSLVSARALRLTTGRDFSEGVADSYTNLNTTPNVLPVGRLGPIPTGLDEPHRDIRIEAWSSAYNDRKENFLNSFHPAF